MLYANDLALEVIQPAYPLDGLGAYAEGVCKSGADFVCGLVGGVHSCRPCSTAQLAAFKDFQGQLNRIVKVSGLASKYLLALDGRIGPLTAATLGAIAKSVGSGPPSIAEPALGLAIANPTQAATHRAIASYVPELANWLKTAADAAGAPTKPPVPSGGASASNGDVVVPPGAGVVTKPSNAGTILAVVGGALGLGLIGYGIYRYKNR